MTDDYINLPSLVSTNEKTTEDIIDYIVKKGDTLSTIAAKFDITTDSIRWANDLPSGEPATGTSLTLPPVTGIIYTVSEGDTPVSLAKRFNANKDRIISFNDAEISGIKPGQTIVIPDGEIIIQEQVTPVPISTSYVAADSNSTTVQDSLVPASGFGFGSEPVYSSYNAYAFGNCTWHASDRRAQVGKPIPQNLGNAATWATLAAQVGFSVGEVPQAYDIIWHKNVWHNGGYGHVAFVESVNPDGTITVSDMNWYDGRGGGFNRVSYRTINASDFGQYLFIH